jgi:hypothetical protein
MANQSRVPFCFTQIKLEVEMMIFAKGFWIFQKENSPRELLVLNALDDPVRKREKEKEEQ